MCASVHTQVYACVCMSVDVDGFVCMHECGCVCVCVHAHMHVCNHVCVHLHACAYDTENCSVPCGRASSLFMKKTTQLSHGKILSWINKVYSAIHKECVAHQKFKIKPVFSEQLMHTQKV